MAASTLKIAIATAVTAIGLALAAPALAGQTLPSKTFDPNATGWASYRNLTSSEFAPGSTSCRARDGRRPRRRRDRRQLPRRRRLPLESRRPRLGQRARSDGRTARRPLGRAQEQGLPARRPGELRARRQAAYAAVFVENRERLGWASFRDASSAGFSQHFEELKAKGLLPIDVDIYPTGGGLRYSSVWDQTTEKLGWRLRRGLTSSEYGAAFDSYRRRASAASSSSPPGHRRASATPASSSEPQEAQLGFGNGILNGSILTPTQRMTLWTAIGSYAFGWDVGTARRGRPARRRQVGRAALARSRTCASIRTTASSSALLANRWGGGHSSSALSKRIGELMLAKLP